MKLTKEQRVYGAVLAVAVFGLAADRFLFGSSLTGPAGAEAGEAPPDPVTPAAAPRQAEAAPGSDLAQRLEALRGEGASGDALADVLTIPPAWFEGEQAKPGPDGGPARPAEPVREYKLTAVAAGRSGAEGFAMVNGRRLSIGESIDGMTLIEIQGRQAIFTAGSEKVVMTVELPMSPTRAEPGASTPR